MIHQELLRRAVAGRPPALVDFVETVAPRLLEQFTIIPALGGSGRLLPLDPRLPEGLSRFTVEEMARFSEKNPDQSLTAHILNGLFAGLRLAERLPPKKALSDMEQRLWVVGYIVHDYTKVYGIKVQAGQLDTIREVIRCLGQDLGFDAYLPDWFDYLDDIVFLAQNTQKVEGANLNLRDYRLKTHPRRLDVLRYLSSYADVLVHIKSPSDVMLPEADGRNTAENLRKTLTDLFPNDRLPRLTYHKLSDVRGLLSNLIHNVVMTQLKEQGYEPYLFFPNGVVYLANPDVKVKADPPGIANAVWERVLEVVGEDETFGVRRAGTGFIPSSGLYELTGLAGVLAVGRRKARDIARSKAAARLYGFLTGESESDLKRRIGNDAERVQEEQERRVREEGLPFDVRVDRLGEFLSMIHRTVSEYFRRAPDIQALLLDTLRLNCRVEDVQAADGKRRGEAKRVRLIEESHTSEKFWEKGGTSFGWFYAAARYVQGHQGLADNGIEDTMQDVSKRVLTWVKENGLRAKAGEGINTAVKEYIAAQLEVDGRRAVQNGDPREAFVQELSRYTSAKAERNPLCSLCSSPYKAVEQEDTEMPFGPQNYTNRHPLGWSKVVRGVCPVCRIEMILRRVQQSGVDEDRRPIQLYLYPTYFFTLETERVAKFFLVEMADLNLFALRQHLRAEGFSLGTFLHFDGFLGDGSQPRRGVRTPAYKEDQPAGLIFASLSPLGRKPTDTDSWIVPALLAVGIPLLLDVKVVATPSFVPLFSSGSAFRETAMLDGPHSFTNHVWGRDRFRVDELEEAIIKLLELYDLHLDVFAKGYDPHWPQLNAVAKDVATDPYYIFSYYERKERSEHTQQRKKKRVQQPTFKGISRQNLDRYLQIYLTLGGETNMGIIGELVDAYAAFYRAKYGKLNSAYAVLKPFTEAADVVVESLPRTQNDDLVLLVEGAVHDLMNRVWDDPQTDGWDPIVMVRDATTSREDRKGISRQKQVEFAQTFLAKLFHGYCNSERAVLRERLNRLRSAARFYYLQNYGSPS